MLCRHTDESAAHDSFCLYVLLVTRVPLRAGNGRSTTTGSAFQLAARIDRRLSRRIAQRVPCVLRHLTALVFLIGAKSCTRQTDLQASSWGVFGSLKERNVLPSVAREWRARCRERPLKTTESCMKKIAIAALGLALSLSTATTSWPQGTGGGAGGAAGGAAAGTSSAGGGVGNSPGASANKNGQGGATTGNKARSGVGNH
jgi:hypothetical protein